MRVLAIETATEACSIALFENGALLAHDHREIGRGHAERLVPMIGGLPDNGRADRILVSLGPGSFTGVRIGLAAARALGFAWQAQVLGYSTLTLVATMAPNQGAKSITVCMNGGHGEWFVQDFSTGSEPSTAIVSLATEEAVARDAPAIVAGNRAKEFARLHKSEMTVCEILPDARQVLMLPASAFTDDLTPVYGRGPDATPQARRESS